MRKKKFKYLQYPATAQQTFLLVIGALNTDAASGPLLWCSWNEYKSI